MLHENSVNKKYKILEIQLEMLDVKSFSYSKSYITNSNDFLILYNLVIHCAILLFNMYSLLSHCIRK